MTLDKEELEVILEALDYYENKEGIQEKIKQEHQTKEKSLTCVECFYVYEKIKNGLTEGYRFYESCPVCYCTKKVIK